MKEVFVTKEEIQKAKEILKERSAELTKRMNQPSLPRKSIYVFEQCGFYKIGYSYNPHKRLENIKCASPNETRLVLSFPIHNVKIVEKELHNRFKDKRIRGEWFELSDGDLQDITNILTEYARSR